MGTKFWTTVRFARTMKKVSAAFKKCGLRHWALGGGNAADYWANPPATIDIDIFAAGKAMAFWKTVDLLERGLGWERRQQHYKGEGGYPGLAMLRNPVERVDVDFLLPSVPLEMDAARTAVPAMVRGTRFRVVRPEYLVAMKLAAGRPKDIRAASDVMASARAAIAWPLLDELLAESGATTAAVKMARILASWKRGKRGGRG